MLQKRSSHALFVNELLVICLNHKVGSFFQVKFQVIKQVQFPKLTKIRSKEYEHEHIHIFTGRKNKQMSLTSCNIITEPITKSLSLITLKSNYSMYNLLAWAQSGTCATHQCHGTHWGLFVLV